MGGGGPVRGGGLAGGEGPAGRGGLSPGEGAVAEKIKDTLKRYCGGSMLQTMQHMEHLNHISMLKQVMLTIGGHIKFVYEIVEFHRHVESYVAREWSKVIYKCTYICSCIHEFAVNTPSSKSWP